MVGMLLTGVFAHSTVNSAVTTNGLFFGETGLFTVHVIAMMAVSIFAFFGSLLLLKMTDMISTLRISQKQSMLDWIKVSTTKSFNFDWLKEYL